MRQCLFIDYIINVLKTVIKMDRNYPLFSESIVSEYSEQSEFKFSKFCIFGKSSRAKWWSNTHPRLKCWCQDNLC